MTNQNNKGFLETLASLENVLLLSRNEYHSAEYKHYKGRQGEYHCERVNVEEFLNLLTAKEHYYQITNVKFTVDGYYIVDYYKVGKFDNKPNFNPADYVNFETNSIDFSDLKSSDFFEFYMNEIMAYVLNNGKDEILTEENK